MAEPSNAEAISPVINVVVDGGRGKESENLPPQAASSALPATAEQGRQGGMELQWVGEGGSPLNEVSSVATTQAATTTTRPKPKARQAKGQGPGPGATNHHANQVTSALPPIPSTSSTASIPPSGQILSQPFTNGAPLFPPHALDNIEPIQVPFALDPALLNEMSQPCARPNYNPANEGPLPTTNAFSHGLFPGQPPFPHPPAPALPGGSNATAVRQRAREPTPAPPGDAPDTGTPSQTGETTPAEEVDPQEDTPEMGTGPRPPSSTIPPATLASMNASSLEDAPKYLRDLINVCLRTPVPDPVLGTWTRLLEGFVALERSTNFEGEVSLILNTYMTITDLIVSAPDYPPLLARTTSLGGSSPHAKDALM